MSAAFHRCQSCSYETVLTNTLGAFDDNPYCHQCGLSASESDNKMQEELSDLISQNLHLTGRVSSFANNSLLPSTPHVLSTRAPVTYTSQHYHHSGHLLHPNTSISQKFENAGLRASDLLPSQIQLFRNASPAQQLRLIEQWRLISPTDGDQILAKDRANWTPTSPEEKEQAAGNPYEVQEGSRYKNRGVSNGIGTDAEPYIINGYADSITTEKGGDMVGMVEGGRKDMAINQNSREWWRLSEP